MVPRTSRGDQLTDVPLHTVEGSDFFTRDIIDTLEKGEADLAVHSLKDMSSAHFFGGHCFAVVDREAPHDVALFRRGWEEKVNRGEPLVIGTCSPRREEMVLDFLQKALPAQSQPVRLLSKPIRGNVETRLQKLHRGDYDGTILALAGLVRLWPDLQSVWSGFDFQHMILPLLDCVPAPCQGSIVVEALPGAVSAISLLEEINDHHQWEDSLREKMTGMRYGQGCLQRFGVTTIRYESGRALFAAGKDEQGQCFSSFSHFPRLKSISGKWFSTTDHMRDFFHYAYQMPEETIPEPVVYIANYKSLSNSPHRADWLSVLSSKRVWAAGTKTWFELARLGLWVEGAADALGLASLESIWKRPLVNISKDSVRVITHEEAARHWHQQGWKTLASHRLIPQPNAFLARTIQEADCIFWTSFGQYQMYREVIREGVLHACPYGETLQRFRAVGIEPLVFPTIKSFLQWRTSHTPLGSVA